MKVLRLLPVLLVLAPCRSLRAAEPRQDLGLSAHLIPKQLADLSPPQRVVSGFVITVPGDARPAGAKPTAASTDALIALFRQQPASVQQNGIWLVLTYSKAYSAAEKARVLELKQSCRQQRIPLFMCRDSELPKGWNRFSARRPAWSSLPG